MMKLKKKVSFVIKIKQVVTVAFQGAKRSPADGDNSTSEPPASQALQKNPAACAVRDARDPTSLQSPQYSVWVPMKPYRHNQVSDSMIADARQKVAGDRRKVAHWRTERASLLVQVGEIDKKKLCYGRAICNRDPRRWWCS